MGRDMVWVRLLLPRSGREKRVIRQRRRRYKEGGPGFPDDWAWIFFADPSKGYGEASDKTPEKEPFALTAIPYQVSAMLRTYGRQVTTARRLARFRRSLRPVDDEEAQISREAKRRELVGRVAAEIVENCIVAGTETPVVEELKAELEEELGFPVVFAYPPEEQEMQIFRKDPGKDAEPLVGEAKAAAMRRLWELALEKVDATMI
jgi:hypothetical protein